MTFRGGGFHKTTLKNIFRGSLFKSPKKGMRIELLMMVAQKPPLKIKLSWVLGRGCENYTSKKTFRVCHLKNPQKS